MVTVDNGVAVKDKRKTRKVAWKEARLCFSRDAKGVKAYFRATLKSTETTGDIWYSSAVSAGLSGVDTQAYITSQARRVDVATGQGIALVYAKGDFAV